MVCVNNLASINNQAVFLIWQLRASSFQLRLVQKRLKLSCPTETAVEISLREAIVQFFFSLCHMSLFYQLYDETSVMPLDYDNVIYITYIMSLFDVLPFMRAVK
jgi:hypothetical protein